jgi:hypothetical protein
MIGVIVQLAAGLLIPLLPAFLLYRVLPSKTIVSGPFAGLKIDLGGAFGGYFLLVLVGLWFLRDRAANANLYERWEMKGEVELEDAGHSRIEEKLLQVQLRPTRVQQNPPVGNRIRYTVTVPVARDPQGSAICDYDSLYFFYPGYQNGYVSIEGCSYKNPDGKVNLPVTALERQRDTNLLRSDDDSTSLESKWE